MSIPKKQLTSEEAIDEATKEYADAMKESVRINRKLVDLSIKKRASHYRVQKAGERLSALRIDLYE